MSGPRSLLPDFLVRAGIRRRVSRRLAEGMRASPEERAERYGEFRRALDESPIAPEFSGAEKRHVLLPVEFYLDVLGPRLLHGCGLWPSAQTTLAESEEAMLDLICSRAGLRNGQKILDLGCGWGALTFRMAERYPDSVITSVPESYAQRLHVEAEARRRELYNVRVVTAELNDFSPPEPGTYDRVISVEMFERLGNPRELMRRIAFWLRPGGGVFVQLFTRREFAAGGGSEELKGEEGLITGLFPPGAEGRAADLLLYCQEDLSIERDWVVNGGHYARTAEAWLASMDAAGERIFPVLERNYGRKDAAGWRDRWREFFMFRAALAGCRGGGEFLVSHSLFRKG